MVLNPLFTSSQPNDYCEKETTDRERIELPENQKSLVMAVRKQVGAKKKIVAVLIHGGAIAFDDETLDALDGIIDAFYPGPHGAEAIAGVLFGDFSPAGRTPVTFYKSTASLPPLGHMEMYPNAKDPNTYPGITYRFYTKKFYFLLDLACLIPHFPTPICILLTNQPVLNRVIQLLYR